MRNNIRLRDRLLCPLVSALIQILVLYTIFFQFFEIKDHYYSSIANAKIKAHIEDKVNQCGRGTWISWLVVDGNVSRDRYYFQDVIGCRKDTEEKGECAFSVKEAKLNPFYNAIYHKLDKCSVSFLNNIPSSEVAFFEDLKALPCETLAIGVGASNSKLLNMGITVTRNTRSNMVYIFTLSQTAPYSEDCPKSKRVTILEELSNYAKENL